MHAQDPHISKHLTFTLDHETYGVNILDVREIRRWTRLTRLPRAPDYLPGVLSLRGTPVPIMDLRRRFGLPANDYDEQTVLVILDAATQPLGLIVDAVTGVEDVPGDRIHPVPSDESIVDERYLTGLAECDRNMVLLLAPERLLRPVAPPRDADTARGHDAPSNHVELTV